MTRKRSKPRRARSSSRWRLPSALARRSRSAAPSAPAGTGRCRPRCRGTACRWERCRPSSAGSRSPCCARAARRPATARLCTSWRCRVCSDASTRASPTRSIPISSTSRCSARRARERGAGGSRGITSRGTSPSSATPSWPSRSSSAPGRPAPTSAYRSVAKGYRTMPREEDAAREIVLLLDGALRKRVVFSQESLTDHLTQNAVRVRPLERVGVLTAQLPSAAQRRVGEIVNTYLANHPQAMARSALARIERAGGLARTRFGWAGQHPPRRASLLPAARTDVRARVRQLPERRNPHPQRVAGLRAGLRAPPLCEEVER